MKTQNTTNATNNFASFEQEMKKLYLDKLLEFLGVEAATEILRSHLEKTTVTMMHEQEQEAEAEKQEQDEKKLEEFFHHFGRKTYTGAAFAAYKYLHNGFETESVLYEIIDSVDGIKKRNYHSDHGAGIVSCENALKYIIERGGEDGKKIVRSALTCAVSASWETGNGITREKIMPIVRVLALHRQNLEQVERAICRILKEFDFISFKVRANEDPRFLAHLKVEDKMVRLLESLVCDKLELETELD